MPMPIVSILLAVTLAGPLTPPAGPPAPTDRALRATDPRTPLGPDTTPGDGAGLQTPSIYKITEPGSYYLTGDVVGAPGFIGIEITASNVVIDLNGFTVRGVAGSADGVRTFAGDRITLRNGSIGGWEGAGVALGAAIQVHLSDLLVSDNDGTGIVVGELALIERCTVANNGGWGITTAASSVIGSSVAAGNTLGGIFAGIASTVVECVAVSNFQVGLRLSVGCVAQGCVAAANVAAGIAGDADVSIFNASSILNQGPGIQVGEASIVRDSAVRRNSGGGIVAGSDCQIVGNLADFTSLGSGTQAGMQILGAGSLITDNISTDNDVGFQASGTGNFVARNYASGNATNWSVVAGNRCLVINSVAAGAIAGDSGGTSPGLADPNANFTY